MTQLKHAPQLHPKQDFQVERIAFFSDAVYAIAITLLVIEFRPPHMEKDSTVEEIWHQLVEMRYLFFAIVFSFFLIITYWMRHHSLFKHIHNYNKQIVIANMVSLFPIIFFPFTTSFFYESNHAGIGASIVAFRLFLVNNILAGLSTYVFYWLVIKKYKQLSYEMDKDEMTQFEVRLGVMAISFLLVLVISFFSFKASIWGILPLAGYNLYQKYSKRKNKTTESHAK